MSDAIKAALVAACNARLAALLNDEPGTEYDLTFEDDVAPIAAAIAAFLRALPPGKNLEAATLAAAVEGAARERGHVVQEQV